jgi:hypothetical protein
VSGGHPDPDSRWRAALDRWDRLNDRKELWEPLLGLLAVPRLVCRQHYYADYAAAADDPCATCPIVDACESYAGFTRQRFATRGARPCSAEYYLLARARAFKRVAARALEGKSS